MPSTLSMHSAKNRSVLTTSGMSPPKACAIGLPMDSVSSRASSAAFSFTLSAKRCITAARFRGARLRQTPFLWAARAAATARSMSFFPAAATSAKTAPVAGLTTVSRPPSAASANAPLIKSWEGGDTSRARARQSIASAFSIVMPAILSKPLSPATILKLLSE